LSYSCRLQLPPRARPDRPAFCSSRPRPRTFLHPHHLPDHLTLCGSTASTFTRSVHSRKRTSRALAPGDQMDLGPNPNAPYKFDSAPQMPQSQYPDFETELTMATDSYPSALQGTMNGHIQTAASPLPHVNTHVNIPVHAPGTNAPGMAPPQAPHHQDYSPSAAPRPSVDDSAPATSDTPKRKRSKVSRACDECRRKKVRVLNNSLWGLAS